MEYIKYIIHNSLFVENNVFKRFKTNIGHRSLFMVRKVYTEGLTLSNSDTRDELGIDIQMVSMKITFTMPP